MDKNLLNKEYWLDVIEKDPSYSTRAVILDIFDLIEKEKCNIGLKDIDGKLIYADSSIIEFSIKYWTEDKTDYDTVKEIGFFTFCQSTLQYIIKDINDSDFVGIYRLNRNDISNIKIIDTIQENKLGLIKE